jgi:hypothetical protein
MNLMSVVFILLFGSYKYLTTRGKYKVGYADITLDKSERKVSVYYPCIDYEPSEYEVYPDWATEGLNTVKGMMIRQGLPDWIQRYLISFKIPAFRDMDMHDDFTKEEGTKDLIPVIFSHGMGSTRTMNSFMLCELASHGCIVFSVDHTDGSCAYYSDSKGDHFYESVPENDQFASVRKAQALKRIDDLNDVQALIQERA